MQVLELLNAVRQRYDRPLRVVVPRDLGPEAGRLLKEIQAHTVTWDEVSPRTGRSEVVHRPYQVADARDLSTLLHLGNRLVVTQQDLIAFNNAAYFGTPAAWEDYRWATRAALALASRVVCVSRHVADAVSAAGLAASARLTVVYNGTDHRVTGAPASPTRPEGMTGDEDLPFLLCLGADYAHKNRVFALAVHEALQRRGSRHRALVFAGPHVAHGSSQQEEEEFLRLHPELSGSVRRLGPVSEAEKWWLLGHAEAVLYPTVDEGFGFIPFEAASIGTPCLCAPRSSLAELLPPEATLLPPGDPDAAAEAIARLLEDPAECRRVVELVNAAAARFTWAVAAEQVIATWESVAEEPPLAPEEHLAKADLHRVGPAALLPPAIRTLLTESPMPDALRPRLARALLDARGAVKTARARPTRRG